MSETDDSRISNLENRLTEIEGYIKCCEKHKDEQWEDNLDKALKDIRETAMSINKMQIKAQWQWPSSYGTTMILIGFNFFMTAPSVAVRVASGLMMLLGVIMMSLGLRTRSETATH